MKTMLQLDINLKPQEVYANEHFIESINDTCDPEWLSERDNYWASKSNYEKTILSLFDYTGNWALPYARSDYNVHCIDIKDGFDINDFCVEYLVEVLGIDEVYGILAAPPCTEFACSGARYFAEKDADGRTEKAIEIINQILRTVEFYNPYFWALENPVGRLRNLVSEINKKPWYFQPCDFGKGFDGEEYNKKTGLFGVFCPPTKANLGEDRSVFPKLGSKMHTQYGGSSARTKELRSTTPMGFANAFFECNQ